MRALRIALAALGAATLVLAATPAHALVDVTVQHESGTIDDTGCGDDGPMAVQTDGTRTVVFHPGSGCSATFYTAVPATFYSIRFKMTGQAGEMCGRFVVSGAISATTGTLCYRGDSGRGYETVYVSGSNTGGSGYYTVTWETTGSTPSWVNAYVDFHVIRI